MGRVAVAMSGGVDSCTAAALLREAGEEVVGITLQTWDYTQANLASGGGRCCSPADIRDARRVAADLDIPHYVFDHAASFRQQVVEPFLDSWAAGQTPSPCIGCNRQVKFDDLWSIARSLGADTLATGHYARLELEDGRPRLRKARDEDKDQSYFLFDVAPDALRHVRFPLGELSKDQVRALADRHALRVADKPESYELCFIPDGDKDAFVRDQRGEAASPAGVIRDREGQILGRHDGIHRFTVGQRRGLGLGGGDALYVLALDPETGAITVGQEDELYADRMLATRCNWFAADPPREPIRARARIRHRHREAPATIEPGSRPGTARVRFDTPQRAIAPGQGVAFYDGDLLLGGGWITSVPRPDSPPCPPS